MSMPPTATAAVAARSGVVFSDRVWITYPESGTAFVIDPVLRPEYQRARLQGAAAGGLLDIAWVVDGERIPGPAEGAFWRLVPGRHTIELHATTPEGQRLRSRPSTITVRGVDVAAR